MARTRKPNVVRWLGVAAPLALIGAIALGALLSPEQATETGGEAPDFTLPDTGGAEISLDDALQDGPALLFFSMGAGCDGCFVQIPEITDELDERGVQLVSIMPGETEWVAAEARRLGVNEPIAVDSDVAVSGAYGMLGQYGHGDQPSHSFALVDSSREITWVRHYAEMFIPAEELIPEIDAALAG